MERDEIAGVLWVWVLRGRGSELYFELHPKDKREKKITLSTIASFKFDEYSDACFASLPYQGGIYKGIVIRADPNIENAYWDKDVHSYCAKPKKGAF